MNLIADKVLEVSTAWSGVAGALTSAVLVPITIGACLLVMWHGINILRGAGGGHHLLDVFAKCLRAFLVVALALSAGAYTATVVAFFQDLRTWLTGQFVTGATTSYGALDVALQRVADTWDPVWSWSSQQTSYLPPDISGLVAIVCWGVMATAFWIFGAICAINLILVDTSLALVFALGPLFVACFAFQSTARFTDAWISAVLKYVFTAVIVAAVTGLGVGILEQYAARITAAGENMQFVVAALSAIGSSIVLGALALRIPALAADMVGGIGLSVFGTSMGKLPVAAAQAAASKAASIGSNSGAYVAGRMASSGPAQALAETSLGQRAIESFARSSSVAQGILGSGGARAAYDLGRSTGTGTVTGRPVGTIHTPGAAPAQT